MTPERFNDLLNGPLSHPLIRLGNRVVNLDHAIVITRNQSGTITVTFSSFDGESPVFEDFWGEEADALWWYLAAPQHTIAYDLVEAYQHATGAEER